jgi:AraC-like DNA-binding protein
MKENLAYWAKKIKPVELEKWDGTNPPKGVWVLFFCTKGRCQFVEAEGAIDSTGIVIVGEAIDMMPSKIIEHEPDAELGVIVYKPAYRPSYPRVIKLPQSSFFQDLVEHLIDALALEGCRHPSVSVYMEAIVLELQRNFGRKTLSEEAGAFLNHLQFKIESNPAYPWDVAEMARESGYSQAHFRRLFMQAHQITPRKFITHVRLTCAESLMISSSMTLDEIAQRVGICDGFQLSRQFTAFRGIRPSQLRLINLNKNS